MVRQVGLFKTLYVPEPLNPNPSQQELVGYLQKQLQQIGTAFGQSELYILDVAFEEPQKTRDGMLVLADGVRWNPGQGAGMYWYLGGVWNKLYDFSQLLPWAQIDFDGSDLADLETRLFTSLQFTGSNLTSLATRLHNDLQSLQGGMTGQYFHLTSAELTELQSQDAVVSTSINYQCVDAAKTVFVTASPVVVTLPSGSVDRIGKSWTICLSVDGELIIQPSSGNTIILPRDTDVLLKRKGSSLTFRCINATTWSIV